MKIGILLCAYSLPEYIPDCLRPWVEAKRTKLGGHEYVISAISVPFKEYKGKAEEDIESPRLLQEYKDRGEIDYLFTEPKWEEEKVVRNTALNPLLEIEKCDITWIWDADEFTTLDEIEKTLKFVERNPLTCWFRGSLKNYVFSDKEFLAQPFNPARIYRTKYQNYKLYGFRADNEVIYIDDKNRIYDHLGLSSLTIPKNVAWTKHLTWPSNEQSKKKIQYQAFRWGNDMCSYVWNEKENKLEFNALYYKSRNILAPSVLKDED